MARGAHAHKHRRVGVTAKENVSLAPSGFDGKRGAGPWHERSIQTMTFEYDGPPGPKRSEDRGGGQLSVPATTPERHQRPASSGQVAWHPVYEYLNRLRRRTGALDTSAPALGSPVWCALPDDHGDKLASVFNTAEGWAYTAAYEQAALAEASKAVAGAEDWVKVAKRHRDRVDFAAAHPWARRAVS